MKKNLKKLFISYIIIFCVFFIHAGEIKHFVYSNYPPYKKIICYSKPETKKYIKTIPSLFQSNKRSTSEEVLRGLTTQVWNTDDDTWQSTAKTQFSYKNGNVVEEITFAWSLSDKKWINTTKVEIMYNSNNNITSVATKVWIPDSSKWIDLTLQQLTYDTSKELVEEVLIKENFRLLYGVTTVEPGLHDLEKQTNTYSNKILKTTIVQAAFPEENRYKLEKYLSIKFTWDNDKQLIEKLIQQWFVTVYMDKVKYDLTYGNSGLLETDLQSIKEENGWEPFRSYEYKYTDFDSLEITLMKSVDSTKSKLVNFVKVSNEYSSEKFSTLIKTDVWMDEGWEPYDKSEFTYENKMLAKEIYQMFSQGNWVNIEQYTYDYSTPIHGRYHLNSMNNYYRFFIINVPACSMLNFSTAVPSVVSIDIYNCSGEYVASLMDNDTLGKGFYRIAWNKRNNNGDFLAPGSYYIRLKVNESFIVKKTIISK